MRNLLLATLFITCSTPLTAQVDFSCLEQGNQWVQEYLYSDGVNPDGRSHTEYAIRGDTIIADRTYAKIYRDSTYYGGLREADGQLLLLRFEEEIMLLDFNLSVGDTILAGLCSGPGMATCDEMVVRSIDTVEILNGSLRQRINFDLYIRTSFNPGKYEVAWIDGVGSTRGLFDTFENCSILSGRSRSPTCFDRLVCMQSAAHLIFNHTEDEMYSCDRESILSSTPTLQLPASLFSLYPNPAREQITLECPEDHQMTQLEVRNSSGQMVYQATLSQSEANFLTLSLTTFPRGIYQLRILTASAHWATVRLVIIR